MTHSENKAGFALNKQFQNIQKIIIEKKSKNESSTSEIEWLIQQLYEKNPKSCDNAVNVLISTSDHGFALNTLLSALQKIDIGNYFIVADGIFKILLLDIAKSGYKCPFKIHQQIHPVIFMVEDSSEKMLYLSRKINSISKQHDV